MIDHETERLHRFLDGQMSDEERTEFEATLASNPEMQAEVASYSKLGSLLREHVDGVVESMEFEGFFDGIDEKISLIEAEKSTSFLDRVRAFILSPSSGTALVLAVVCLIFFMQSKQEAVPTSPTSSPAPVVVEQKPSNGTHLIQVSKPVNKDEPAVIWLLEDEKDGGVRSDSSIKTPF